MEFLVYGGFLFWILIAILAVMLTATAEKGDTFWFSSIVAATLVGLQFFSDTKPLSFMFGHTVEFFFSVIAYVVVGIFWGIAKWYSHVYSLRDRFVQFKRDKLPEWRSLPQNQINAYGWFDADGTLTQAGELHLYERASAVFGTLVPPSITKSKSQFMLWTIAWPFSAFWTVFDDPLRRLYRFIYYRLSGTLQAISDKAFTNL